MNNELSKEELEIIKKCISFAYNMISEVDLERVWPIYKKISDMLDNKVNKEQT